MPQYFSLFDWLENEAFRDSGERVCDVIEG